MKNYMYSTWVILSALVGALHSPWVTADAGKLTDELIDVRTFVTKTCPLSNAKPEAFGASVIAALAPSFMGAGIDLLTAALTAAGADKATALKASTYTYMYSSDANAGLSRNEQFGCLVIIGTTFGHNPTIPDVNSNADLIQWTGANSRLGLGVDAKVMKGRPRFYFEAVVKTSAERSAFRLEPVMFRLTDPVESPPFGALFGRPAVSTTIAVSFAVPGEATPFASALFTIPVSKTPIEFEKEALTGMTSTWMPLHPPEKIKSLAWDREKAWATAAKEVDTKRRQRPPHVDDAKIQALNKAYCDALTVENEEKEAGDRKSDPECPTENEQRKIRLLTDRADAQRLEDIAYFVQTNPQGQPLPLLGSTNVEVLVTETRKGSKFAAYLATAISGAKNDLVTAAKTQLPESRRAADRAEQDVQDENDAAAWLAKANVEKAQQEIDKLTADASAAMRAEKEASLKQAQAIANKAFRKAGWAQRY